jgi:hypothetical protein
VLQSSRHTAEQLVARCDLTRPRLTAKNLLGAAREARQLAIGRPIFVAIEVIPQLAQDETENDEGTVKELLSQDEIFAVWDRSNLMRSGDAYQEF